ncbi:G-type lectin S-receptor-like serine/threonine-protein kinase RLK1 [Vitis vinifera]|uniref:Receptor-like serine/threonine-protein kinase n=1 Tax=Vitis vinifera TaxID=29760 RepID=A0A438KGD5_VITVI|nr:G-type lectin S-receptor-like serine/threonine-protein kinase RLK1 [Vitis vinifera]
MAFSMLHLAGHLFLFVLLLPSWPLVFSQADSRIPLGSSLLASHDSSSWPSPSGEFAFGFYPLDGQAHFLLAIWYEKISEKTLVWYANGGNPAPEGSKVELTSEGQFILSDPKGNKIWEPDSSINGIIAYALMLDNGNFVLTNGSGNSGYAWESFKSPSDTILPGQILDIGGTLSSRRAEGNYSKGRFQLRLIPDGNFVLNTLDVLTDTPTDAYYWSNTYSEDRKNAGHQGTLDFDGIFTIYTRPKSTANGSWVPSWSIPKDICSENWGESGSGICGFNTHCILDSNGRPICECFPGFSYIDPSNNFSGCKQDRPQKCEPGELRPLENEEDCWKSCLYDCNCIVAVPIGSACEKKRLPLTNGRVDGSTNRKAFIKLPKPDASSCEPPIQNPEEKSKGQATLILVGSFLLGGSVFLNFLLAAAISLVRLRSGQERQKITGESSILERNIRSFTYKELEEATDGFREVLGRGAFGTVYKGVLSSSNSRTHVAVKNLDRLAQERENEFKTEASIIAMTHHKNLVRLLGFCDEGPHKLLVYEFMSNGTLASFLFGDSRPDWKKRMGLAFGIARGIMYLHEECSTQIIHCDIKPQNILLDDSFTARISDFGLAKLLMSDQSRTLTAIRGTKGYEEPRFATRKEEEAILTDWAYDCYQGGRVEKLVENDEEARNYMRTVERLVMVAIWCIQEDPALRPSMRNVIQMLEGVAEVPVPPCPFPYSSAI